MSLTMGEKTYSIKGECVFCGDCCKGDMVDATMCRTNNIINGILYCDCTYQKPDKTFCCKLIDEIIKYEPVSISQSFDGTLISDDVKIASGLDKEQADWCLRVMAFPNFEAEGLEKRLVTSWITHLKTRNKIPNCGFSLEVE